MNIIKFELYSQSLVKLLAWFIGSFQFNDVFRILVMKNSKFNKSRSRFNNFESDKDIEEYVGDPKNYHKTLVTCLENNLQNLAM
jgi:hypothetical protein